MADYVSKKCKEQIKIDAESFAERNSEIENTTITNLYFDIEFTTIKYTASYPDGYNPPAVTEYDLTNVRYTGADSVESSFEDISESEKDRVISRVAAMFYANTNEFLNKYAVSGSDNLVAYSSLEDLIRTAEDQRSSDYLPLPNLSAGLGINQAFVMEQVTGSMDSYGVEAFRSLYNEDGPDNSADWDKFRELRNMIIEAIVNAVSDKVRELGSDEGIIKVDTKSINIENLWSANSSLYDTIEDLMHGYIKSKLGA